MDDENVMSGLSADWSITNPLMYFAAVILFSVGIRGLHSLLRAIRIVQEVKEPKLKYLAAAWQSFKGFGPKAENNTPDYWMTFILGTIEIGSYPVLMAAEAWVVVGAWIGLKTIAQWSAWSSDRSTFNLFLIGNALVVIAAYLFLRPLVLVPTIS